MGGDREKPLGQRGAPLAEPPAARPRLRRARLASDDSRCPQRCLVGPGGPGRRADGYVDSRLFLTANSAGIGWCRALALPTGLPMPGAQAAGLLAKARALDAGRRGRRPLRGGPSKAVVLCSGPYTRAVRWPTGHPPTAAPGTGTTAFAHETGFAVRLSPTAGSAAAVGEDGRRRLVMGTHRASPGRASRATGGRTAAGAPFRSDPPVGMGHQG